MRDNEFDLHLATWLGEGPTVAPERLVQATLAKVTAHRSRRMGTADRVEATRRTFARGRWTLAWSWAAIAVGAAVVLGGLIYFDSRHQVVTLPAASPSPTPAPTVSYPTQTRVEAAIDGALLAWRRGDANGASRYYTNTARMVAFADGTLVSDPDPFPIIAESRRWDAWERHGPPFGEGLYWAHRTSWRPVTVGWGPGYGIGSDGFAVYRFGAEDRIAAEWLLVDDGYQRRIYDTFDPDAVIINGRAPANVVRFIDGCLAASSQRDFAIEVACFAPDADTWISEWRSEGGSFSGHGWHDFGVNVYVPEARAITRTDQVFLQGDMVAYPFRAIAPSGRVPELIGIDVIQLTPDHSRIQRLWSLFGRADGG